LSGTMWHEGSLALEWYTLAEAEYSELVTRSTCHRQISEEWQWHM